MKTLKINLTIIESPTTHKDTHYLSTYRLPTLPATKKEILAEIKHIKTEELKFIKNQHKKQ